MELKVIRKNYKNRWLLLEAEYSEGEKQIPEQFSVLKTFNNLEKTQQAGEQLYEDRHRKLYYFHTKLKAPEIILDTSRKLLKKPF